MSNDDVYAAGLLTKALIRIGMRVIDVAVAPGAIANRAKVPHVQFVACDRRSTSYEGQSRAVKAVAGVRGPAPSSVFNYQVVLNWGCPSSC